MDVLEIVKSKTVVGWHRAGFRLYWRWHSRARGGRPKITEEIRALIRQMAEENAGWGAPKIHGELLKLGLVVCERTVARYLRRIHRRGNPSQSWLSFLENHREVIVAFDFFTVPSVTFRLLHCFFVIEHGRRKILHFNVTRHPTAEWVVQQLREAFPEAGRYRYAISDRDSRHDADVIGFLKATGLKVKQTSFIEQKARQIEMTITPPHGELEQIQPLLGHASVQTTEAVHGDAAESHGCANDHTGLRLW